MFRFVVGHSEDAVQEAEMGREILENGAFLRLPVQVRPPSAALLLKRLPAVLPPRTSRSAVAPIVRLGQQQGCFTPKQGQDFLCVNMTDQLILACFIPIIQHALPTHFAKIKA